MRVANYSKSAGSATLEWCVLNTLYLLGIENYSKSADSADYEYPVTKSDYGLCTDLKRGGILLIWNPFKHVIITYSIVR